MFIGNKMKKIVLDTNFLLIPAQFKVDIFSEIDRIMTEPYEIYIVDKTIDELKKIIMDTRQKLKDRKAAGLALQLIEAKKIPQIKTEKDKSVDDLIMGLKGYIVATQDIELKMRLKAKKVRIITLRAKKKLIVL